MVILQVYVSVELLGRLSDLSDCTSLSIFTAATQSNQWLLSTKRHERKRRGKRGLHSPNIGLDYSINQQRSSKYPVHDGGTSNDVQSEYMQAQALSTFETSYSCLLLIERLLIPNLVRGFDFKLTGPFIALSLFSHWEKYRISRISQRPSADLQNVWKTYPLRQEALVCFAE